MTKEEINQSKYFDPFTRMIGLEVEELREATLRNGTAVLSATYRAPRGFDPEALIGDRFSPCGPEELFPLHMRSMEK